MTKPTDPREILDKPGASDLLQISPRTLDEWMRKKLIPYAKLPSGAVRFRAHSSSSLSLSMRLARRLARASPWLPAGAHRAVAASQPGCTRRPRLADVSLQRAGPCPPCPCKIGHIGVRRP